MQKLLTWVFAVPASDDDWEFISGRLFLHILLLNLFMMVCYFVASTLNSGQGSRPSPVFLGLLLFITIDLIILKSGYRQVALILYSWGIWAILAYNSFIGIGVYAPAYFLVIVPIILSAIGIDKRASILFTTVTIGFSLFLVYQHTQGIIPRPPIRNLQPASMWVISTALFAGTYYIAVSIRQHLTIISRDLRQNRAFYHAIIEDQEEFIIRWKPNGKFTFANDAYCRYFVVDSDDILNLNMFSLIPESSRQWIHAKMAKMTPENPSITNEHIVELPNGSEGWHQWTDRAIYDDNGVVVEYQSVGREITVIKEFEERQRELLITQERETFLREFLSSMSHDLQSPLSSIRMNLYMMRQNPKSIDKRAERIEKQIDKLSTMFDDILHVARLTHIPELNKQKSQLDSIINSSLNPLLDRMAEKNIQFTMSEITPVQIMADVSELERAFSNLIGNAIKYTPEEGCVSLNINKQEKDVVIEIKDTGIGIAEDDLPHIFERFYRAKNAVNFEKGTGLGLAIVKRIIELHDGTIEVISIHGQGTTFTVRLPIHSEIGSL